MTNAKNVNLSWYPLGELSSCQNNDAVMIPVMGVAPNRQVKTSGMRKELRNDRFDNTEISVQNGLAYFGTVEVVGF